MQAPTTTAQPWRHLRRPMRPDVQVVPAHGDPFTLMWSTRHVPVTHLSGRHARVDVTLDGVRFTRTESDAARRSTDRVRDIAWDDVRGAAVETTPKGREVLRIAVAGTPVAGDHRVDPYALKVPRKASPAAAALAEHINAEVAVRRTWREHAQSLVPPE
jgi:hypothetical protein